MGVDPFGEFGSFDIINGGGRGGGGGGGGRRRGGDVILDAMMTCIQTVLVNVRVNDGIGLDVDGVATAVGFHPQSEVGVGIDVPVETTEEPHAAVVVAEGGVACYFISF